MNFFHFDSMIYGEYNKVSYNTKSIAQKILCKSVL